MKLKLEMTSHCFLRGKKKTNKKNNNKPTNQNKKKFKKNASLEREGSVKAGWGPGYSHPHLLWVSFLGSSNTDRILGR